MSVSTSVCTKLPLVTGPLCATRTASAKPIRAWYIETVGGCEFGPYLDELEAHADAVMRRIERNFGEYAVYARTELDGAPNLDDIRSRLSFEIG